MSTPKPPAGIPLYKPSNGQDGWHFITPETEGEAQARAALQEEPPRSDWMNIAINVGMLVMGILIGYLLRGGAR